MTSAQRIESLMPTNPHCSVVSFGTTRYHERLRTGRGRRIATPMDFLSHINLGEMFGDLTVTAFLILQPTSVVVVGSIVIFPLIDLAPHTTRLGGQRGPWLFLRSNFLRQLISGYRQTRGVGTLRLFTVAARAPNHATGRG